MRSKLLIPVALILVLLCGCSKKIFVDSDTAITDMRRYSEGLAAIKIDDKWGYINENEALIVEPQFSLAMPFSDGLAPVQLNKKWGVIDTKGKYAIIPAYEELGQYSQGLMAYLENNKWGFISQQGTVKIPAQFDEVRPFHEGYAAARMDTHWGYIDKKGLFVINPRFAYAGNFSSGLAPVSETNAPDSYGYINSKGAYAIAPQFDGAETFSEKLAAVYDDGKWGYIDKKGKMVINLKYDCAQIFASGLAAVRDDGLWGYIDNDGKTVIPIQYKIATPFLWGGRALVLEQTGRAHYIDEKGGQYHSFSGGITEPVQPDFPHFPYIVYFPYGGSPDKPSMKRLPESVAGFYEIKPITYSFKDAKKKISFTTTTSRIFYSFHAAKNNPSDAPLFVMLNGGPGAATMTNLFSFNTAPYTLDRERQDKNSPGYSPNPYSWTNIGNVMYIDAPATGFSYLVTPDNQNWWTRASQFIAKGNFNPYIDADQIVRVVLRFLAEFPEIRANQVILVGESYGGTRVSTMLNLLLFNQDYRDGRKLFADPGLVNEIQSHFKRAYPDDAMSPELVARQFGRQILIQPQLTGKTQDDVSAKMFFNKDGYTDTVMYDLAKESGYKYEFNKAPYPDTWLFCRESKRESADCAIMGWLPYAFHRDRYNTMKPTTWSDDLEAYTLKTLRDPDALSTVLGQDVATIPLMGAADRKDGLKLVLGIKTSGGYTVTRDQAEEEKIPDGKWYLDPRMAEYLPQDKSRYARVEAMEESLARTLGTAHEEAGVLFDEEKLEKRLGKLNHFDGYMIPMNVPGYLAYGGPCSTETVAFDVDPGQSPRYGKMFLENVSLVNTFLTDCEHDLVIYSPAIPESLKTYPSVKDILYARGKELRSFDGVFEIQFAKDGLAPYKTPEKPVKLRYPYYERAGHSVSSEQPDKFIDDVREWMRQ